MTMPAHSASRATGLTDRTEDRSGPGRTTGTAACAPACVTARAARPGDDRPTMEVVVQTHSRRTATAVVTGELDIATAPAMSELVIGAIDLGGRTVVIDLSGVTFCDSQGLAALVRIAERAAAVGGSIVLAGVRPGTARLLRITGLGARFAVGSALDCASPAA